MKLVTAKLLYAKREAINTIKETANGEIQRIKDM